MEDVGELLAKGGGLHRVQEGQNRLRTDWQYRVDWPEQECNVPLSGVRLCDTVNYGLHEPSPFEYGSWKAYTRFKPARVGLALGKVPELEFALATHAASNFVDA